MRERPKYTLDDFFRVTCAVNLAGKEIAVRTLSNVELQASARAGRLASMARRKEFTDGPEREALDTEIAGYDDEQVLNLLKGNKAIEIENKLRLQQPFESPIMPDAPSTKEEEETLAERDRARTEYEERILRESGKILEGEMAKIKDIKIQREMLRGYLVDGQCLRAFNETYNRHWLHYACTVNGKPLFKAPEDVGKFSSQAFGILLDAAFSVQGVDLTTMEDFFETAS